MKRCYFCKGEIIKKKVQHIHIWGDKMILFKQLPSEVCKQCGERYFAPDVLEIIDKVTTGEFKTKESINIPVVPFSELVGGRK